MVFIPPLGGIFYFCTMRNNNQQSLKEIIEQFLKESKLDSGIAVTQLNGVWDNIVGIDIASHTKKLEIKNGRLLIHLDSSVARSELHYTKSEIIEKVNAHFSKQIVESIILL
jgi:hypothetical protein